MLNEGPPLESRCRIADDKKNDHKRMIVTSIEKLLDDVFQQPKYETEIKR